ncbi:interleukin-2 receptor subunit beta-like [Notolabrus celidotus]|uniref:interleukin-2 receptor subunit beta-like n=1 Tax=Notolabrus celidotus TaxID=1203425 RepID=UPI00148F9D7A|nr:interleukin-2 receptor subunit beta-like [Notolabrus celidotus]
MSHTVDLVWMELFVLLALFSLDAASSHNVSEGLSCLNDMVNNVSCTWRGSQLAPRVDCWISGVRMISNKKGMEKRIERCQLKQHTNSLPGCSFVFEKQMFTCFIPMPYIRMECNGTLVDNFTYYDPCSHVKMHPPGFPNVSRSANETKISWSKGSPVSVLLLVLNFQVQIKQKHQSWKEARIFSTQNEELIILAGQLKGHCQARVRVQPSEDYISLWSDWSPTTSWLEATDKEEASQDQNQLQISLVTWAVTGSLVLILVVMLVLYRCCFSRGHHKKKAVPNPSKYFHTLYSVHGGNLKEWMNPLPTSESFFTAQPCEYVSPVELCESLYVLPSTSPSSTLTCALLHIKGHTSAGSNTSGVIDNSSSTSSSFFSNMGYFMSSSPSSSAPTDPSPAYFTYQEDFHNLHNSRALHLSLCPSFKFTPAYESLKREPQSPDSGFGIGKEDENIMEDEEFEDVKGEELSAHHQGPPLLLLPLHPPFQMFPFSVSPSHTPNAPSLTLATAESSQVDEPEEAAGEIYAAWPLAGAMCRSSSMPVEPCKTGYLTLKELQTTFSNKSI